MTKLATVTKLITISSTTKDNHHQNSELFSFTQSFDTSLPLCSLLLERSPDSNLTVAPQVNVRQVDPLNYGKASHSCTGYFKLKVVIYCQIIQTTLDERTFYPPTKWSLRNEMFYIKRVVIYRQIVQTTLDSLDIMEKHKKLDCVTCQTLCPSQYP